MTRSSSLTPVGSGRAPSVEMSASAIAGAPSPLGSAPARVRTDGANVFHAPQLGQRPTQRSEVASQAVQR
jgi:hypothetical protein